MSIERQLTDEQIAELWEQYQSDMANDCGFGAPSEWGKGTRNFKAFVERMMKADPSPKEK